MGYVFYRELFAYVGMLVSYFTTTIVGDTDWIHLNGSSDYCLMMLRALAWFCCLYLIVKVEFGELRTDGISYCKSFWNWLNFISYGAILVSIPFESFCKSKSPAHHGLISLINASLWINLLQYLCIHKSTGILINTMGRMVHDVRQFLMLYSVFLLGFSSALHSIMEYDDGYKTYGDTFITVLLMLFGNLTYDPYSNATGWKWVFSNLLLFVYLISVVVMLLNVLIAMMSSSFELIAEAAEAQYFLNRTETILRIERTIPQDVRETIFKKTSAERTDPTDMQSLKVINGSSSIAMVQPLLSSLGEAVNARPKGDIELTSDIQYDSKREGHVHADLPPSLTAFFEENIWQNKPLEDGFHNVTELRRSISKSAQTTTNEDIAMQIQTLMATVDKIESFQNSVNEEMAQRFDNLQAFVNQEMAMQRCVLSAAILELQTCIKGGVVDGNHDLRALTKSVGKTENARGDSLAN